MKIAAKVLAIALLLSLAACGNKGDLYLPETEPGPAPNSAADGKSDSPADEGQDKPATEAESAAAEVTANSET